jgi:hypothetical protein
VANLLLNQSQEGSSANLKKKLKLSWLFIYGLRPWYAWTTKYPKELEPIQFLKSLLCSSIEIESFEVELKDFVIDMASKVDKYVRTLGYFPGVISRSQAVLLYLITRLHRPKIIFETGVAQGLSTAFFLKGLHENGEGKLFSIDLPFFEGGSNNPRLPRDEIYPILKGLQPGWMIPDYLRDRWELIQGNTMDYLAPLLDQLGTIGLFFQDDLNMYRHMLYELRTAWPHIREDGLLLCHNWKSNPALCQLAFENQLPLVKCCRMGCISRLLTLSK